MNGTNLSNNRNVAKPRDSIILKFSLIGCFSLALLGLTIFIVNNHQTIANPQTEGAVKASKAKPKLTTKPPVVVTKKPQKPIVIEEQSDAWFCLKSNGGDSCLNRDRFAHNYQVVAPPKPQQIPQQIPQQTYEDYLVQYGIREPGGCDRYFNGQPNC